MSPIAHHDGAISAGVIHASSRRFATAGTDGIVRFWSADSGKRTGATKSEPDSIVAIAFSAEGHSLFAAYLGGTVSQWKVHEGTLIGSVMKHSEKMDALAVAPSGGEIATGCRNDSSTSGMRAAGTLFRANFGMAIRFSPSATIPKGNSSPPAATITRHVSGRLLPASNRGSDSAEGTSHRRPLYRRGERAPSRQQRRYGMNYSDTDSEESLPSPAAPERHPRDRLQR